LNQPQQLNGAAPAAAPATEQAGSPVPSFDERAESVFSSESAADPSSPAPAASDGSTADSGDPSAAARAERRRQLDAVLAQERARVDAQARQREAAEATRRAEQAERKAAELEARLNGHVDPSKLDAQGFFALAKRLQIPPADLGKWLKDQEQNPELIAQHVARQTIDPKIAELERRLAEQDAQLAQFNQRHSEEQQRAIAIQRGSAMLSFTEQAATQAPHSAAFLKKFGPEEFLKLANSASPVVPNGSGWEQHVLDSVEDMLTHLGSIYGQPQAAPPQQRQAPPSPHPGAAKPMTTVSNTLAQTRASVVEEADLAKLPFEERSRIVFSD